MMWLQILFQELFDESEGVRLVQEYLEGNRPKPIRYYPYLNHLWRNTFYGPRRDCKQSEWLVEYNDILFYRFFRMKKSTFHRLLLIVLQNDTYHLLKRKYRGGNVPITPEEALLIFLWFMAQEDSLQCIGHSFKVAASTVMQIVNELLYIVVHLKNKYIFWPKTIEEFNYIIDGFHKYPGTVGAIDCSHVNLKVPTAQHDSYVDRFQSHSINLLGICTAEKIFSYVFIGFPGSAHDSRVLSYSAFIKNIERHGANYYIPNREWHIIGDAGFPIRTWLMTPYRDNGNLGRIERHHNTCLSSARIAIENVFGIVKGRWRRIRFINTYTVAKAVEITTAACVLHNFCYQNNDDWSGEIYKDNAHQDNHLEDNNGEETRLGRLKRDTIARNLFININ